MMGRALVMLALSVQAGACSREPSQAFEPAVQRLAGFCDASAIVALGGGRLLLASDERNAVLLVDATASPVVRAEFDLDAALRTDLNKRGKPKEADIEAAARIGDTIYWIGSHGNDREGHAEPSRRRLAATQWLAPQGQGSLRPVGQPVTGLLEQLTRGSSEAGRALRAAAGLPHLRGGLDVEGLAGTERGGLLIGFRSPLVQGKAIVVELLNPAEVTLKGAMPLLNEPMLVDLGGRGVRDMVAGPDPGEFLLLAGPAGTEGDWTLFRWRPSEAGARPAGLALPGGVAWEALALDPETREAWLAADDGDAGEPACKKRPKADRSFRLWRSSRL